MKNRLLCGVCCAAVSLLSCLGSVWAQPLADRVPDDAIVYVGWRGADSLPPGFQQSHLKALLDESNIPELFSQFAPALMRRIAAESPEAQEPMQTFLALAKPLWQHPTALWFAGVDFSGPEPMPKIALICQAGPDAQAMHETLEKHLANAGPDVPFRALRSGDVVGIYCGYPDEKAALAGDGSAVRAIGASAAFKSALAELQQPEPVVVFYADVERGIAQVNEAIDKQNDPEPKEIWPKVRDASGLTGFKRVTLSNGFDGKDWVTRGFAEVPAPRKGLLSLLDSKPLSDDLFKAIPQSATMVYAGKFDPGRLITEARNVAGAVDPQAQQMFDKGLGAAKMFLGKDLQADILDPLGEEWAMYVSPDVAGNGITGLVVVNKLDDAKKAEQGLIALSLCVNNLIAGQMREEKLSLSFKNTKIGDMRVWYFAVPLVAPSWGIKDGNLYLGLYPQSVGAAARFGASGKKSFAENEKFAALKQRLGVKSPRGVEFVDLPQLAQPGYQLILAYVRLGLGFADMWGVEAPEPVLPAFDTLQAHLAPSGSMSWVDEKGWHTKGVAPFPGAGVFAGEAGFVSAGGAALGASILLPSLNRARETANRVKCASNMRQMGQGMFLYANDKNGNFPEDYATLVKYMIDTGGIAPDVFTCPSGHARPTPKPANMMKPDELAAWATEASPYVYLGGGKTNNMPADIVVLYERIGSHDNDGVNMLYGDGHVEFHSTSDAEQILQQQGVEVEYIGRR